MKPNTTPKTSVYEPVVMLKNVDGTTIEAQAAAQPKTRPGPLAWVQMAAGEKWIMERVGMNYHAQSGINLRAMDFYFIANGIEAVRVRYKHPTRTCLLYTSPSPRDRTRSRMPSSA